MASVENTDAQRQAELDMREDFLGGLPGTTPESDSCGTPENIELRNGAPAREMVQVAPSLGPPPGPPPVVQSASVSTQTEISCDQDTHTQHELSASAIGEVQPSSPPCDRTLHRLTSQAVLDACDPKKHGEFDNNR